MRLLNAIPRLVLTASCAATFAQTVHAEHILNLGCPKIVGNYRCVHRDSSGQTYSMRVYLDTTNALNGTVDFRDSTATLGIGEWYGSEVSNLVCSRVKRALLESRIQVYSGISSTNRKLFEYKLNSDSQLVVKAYRDCSLDEPCDERNPINYVCEKIR